MKPSTLSRIGLTFGFISIILFAGCFMSKVTLIDPTQAKVNVAFLGNWDNSEQFDSTGREAGLVIRNIDDKLYYVEWRSKSGPEVSRCVGFTTEIRGVTFAHLRGLDVEGKIDDQWLICRIDLTGNRITIRQLDDEFFKNRVVNTPAALRQVIEQNLDNAQMYDSSLTATKK